MKQPPEETHEEPERTIPDFINKAIKSEAAPVSLEEDGVSYQVRPELVDGKKGQRIVFKIGPDYRGEVDTITIQNNQTLWNEFYKQTEAAFKEPEPKKKRRKRRRE